MEYKDLKGKTVIVTGAGGGIGCAILESFLRNKSKVIAFYNNTEPAVDKNLIRSGEVVKVKMDLCDTVKLEQWFAEYEKNDGSIDILINNAGLYTETPLESVTRETWDSLMEINLKTPVFMSKMAMKRMKDNTGGVIINTVSYAATLASVNKGVYGASKAALRSITRSMASEWAPYNIRVNAVSPGVILTGMTESVIKNNKEELLKDISLNRFGTVNEVADIYLFLASKVSSYLNGADIDVSGGKNIVQNCSNAWMKE